MNAAKQSKKKGGTPNSKNTQGKSLVNQSASKPVSKPKAKQPTEKETQLQVEIDRLKMEVLMLRCDLNPDKIEKEIQTAYMVSSEDLPSLLQKQIRGLEYKLKEYESTDTSARTKDMELQHQKGNNTHETEINKDQIISTLKEKVKSLEKAAAERAKDKEQESESAKSTNSAQELHEKFNALENQIKLKDEEIAIHKATIEDKKTLIDKIKEDLNNEKRKNVITETPLQKEEPKLQNDAAPKKEADEMNSMRGQLNELKRDKYMLEEEKKTLQNATQKLEEEKNTLQKDYIMLKEEKKNMQKNLDTKNEEIKLMEEKNKTPMNKNSAKESLEKETKTLKSANNKLEEEKKNLQNLNDRLEKEKQSLQSATSTLVEEKNTLQNANNSLKTEKETIQKKLDAKNAAFKQMEEENKTAINKNTSNKNNRDTKSPKAEKGQSSTELKEAKAEIEELKHRLSQVVGAKIMDNNPNITDLSDENRPTKLSEKYSELYDNEWTDAFEEVEQEGKSEQKVIQHLYHMLLEIFAFCQKTSDEYSKNIKSSVLSLSSAAKERPNTSNIGVTNKRQLKELQKSFSPYLAQDVFKHYVKTKKLDFSKKGKTEIFTRKCIEICWLMSCQDPPVILDTANVKGEFDGDKFRTYTKSGKSVDFVVWPPLMLHKDGPLLCKGVAQGK